MRFSVFTFCFAALLLSGVTYSQSTTSSSPSSQASTTPTDHPSVSLSLTTGSVTLTVATTSGNQQTQVITVIPAVFNVTRTLTPSASSSTTSASQTSSASSTPTPSFIVLETKVDPAFGVLGAILILTGLPSAFWGHKNRWTSFFLIGFYTLALVCSVLIIKFGVLPSINPPNKTLRGMFVLASTIAGFAGGAIAIFFWKGARYGIGAWGGFAFALWVQCFHNGGIIKPIGFRWILYIGCAVIGFILSTIPKVHYHVLLISTSIVGASAFMLGVDCYTTAGLKEFYVWNLGFPSLFPKYTSRNIQFPVSQTMQIELGLIGAITLMGAAVQLRILKVLQRKLHEIAQETKKKDEQDEAQASSRLKELEKEREAWEIAHPTLTKHGRQDSLQSTPLMKGRDGSTSPFGEPRSSYTLAEEGRARHLSGVSEFKVAPTSEEELRRASRYNQNAGVLPAMDLGLGIEEDVPANFIAKDEEFGRKKTISSSDLEDLKQKEALLQEIQTIRRSLDILKSETPGPGSSSSDSRRPSITSRRTLSMDAHSALLPVSSHLRPPRAADPRARVHSMELSGITRENEMYGDSISRPTSVPLQGEDWDTYIQERKLLQPPSGVTPPIGGTLVSPAPRIPIPQAVHEALNRRKVRESALEVNETSSDDIPVGKLARQKRGSTGETGGVIILPPKKQSAPIMAPIPRRPAGAGVRTRTFEELNERHREKMRDMQAPLTEAERQNAELNAAKQRWERSKAAEKEAVGRRQAEKVAAMGRRKEGEGRPRRNSQEDTRGNRNSRALSKDKLATVGMSSKRMSTLKVEDWQRYNEATEMGTGGSRGLRTDSVPFPDGGGRRSRDELR